MAYDQLGARVGAAHNQAANIVAALIASGASLTDDEIIVGVNKFAEAFLDSANTIQAKEEQNAAPAPRAAEAALRSELGATPVDRTVGVEIISTKADPNGCGPIPDWLVEEASKAGVTKVFDNRGKIQRKEMAWNAPHFKSPKDQGDVAFWPPRDK